MNDDPQTDPDVDSPKTAGTRPVKKLNFVEKGLIWLSAADSEVLEDHCPKWERLKYAAFGASLLVPFLFGMIAASYAVSTLTQNWYIIIGFSLIWGYIIITIDRALLASYRSFISKKKKFIQFTLRMTVAILMGLTVSHPLTLMLFRDAINSEIERVRNEEMAQAGSVTDAQKKDVNDRIAKATENLQGLQQRYQEVIGGSFLNEKVQEAAPLTRGQTIQSNQFADIDGQIDEYKRERDQVQSDLNRWQKVYDDEISGARTGQAGIGPNARAIERDELVWRREEVRRIGKVIADLTAKRTDLSAKLMAETARENAEVERSRRELEQQKIEMFKSQQGELLAVLKGQIDSASAELSRLRTESEQLTDNTIARVDSLKDEKRADLLVQTMTLHHMFKHEGGSFALAVYVVITCLFTLIDTIPLVIKFFAEPGIYDHYQQHQEQDSGLTGGGAKVEQKDYSFNSGSVRHSIVEAAFKNVLKGDITQDQIDEMFQATRKKLDFVESVEKYVPLEFEVPRPKKSVAPEEAVEVVKRVENKPPQDEKDLAAVKEIVEKAKPKPEPAPAARNETLIAKSGDPGLPEPRNTTSAVKPEEKLAEATPKPVEAPPHPAPAPTRPVNGNPPSPNGHEKPALAETNNEIPIPSQPAPQPQLKAKDRKIVAAPVKKPEPEQPAPNPAASAASSAPVFQAPEVSAPKGNDLVAEAPSQPTPSQKPIQGKISIPEAKKVASPKKPAEQVPVAGNVVMSTAKAEESVPPSNDFVEGGWGSHILQQAKADLADSALYSPQQKARDSKKGQIAINPLSPENQG